MTQSTSFLAVDLGASNGRVMEVEWDGRSFLVREVHRFANQGVRAGSHLYWDVLGLWSHIQDGIARFKSTAGKAPAGIGVDAWGVDYALLDSSGDLLSNPLHYRDKRTDGMVERMHAVVSDAELFNATGVQTMPINTAFQLASVSCGGGAGFQSADCLLMMPDLFQYFLSGEKRVEYTEATTTQLFSLKTRKWVTELIEQFNVPTHIFPAVAPPGSILAPMRKEVSERCSLGQDVPCIAVASHDTASAVAAIPEMDRQSVFLSSGTWSLMGTLAEEANTSGDAFRLGFTNEGAADGGVLLLKNLTGLWVLQECARCWGAKGSSQSWEAIENAAGNAEPFRSFIDPSALEFQAPADMVAVVQQFCGETGQPIPQSVGEIARCALESLCLLYRSTVEDIRKLTDRSLTAIRVVGGGSLNRLLCQMTADACEIEVVAGPVEAAALGNGLLQAIATGHLKNFGDAKLAIFSSVDPKHYMPSQDERWQRAFMRFCAIRDMARNAKAKNAAAN